ncbi:MAG: mandelate racemase/muconate lactonizing enzyme family protein [Acidaminococcales bacterium]|jgi:muconate cycloisomerase|nr:mandelate racemase/muconate lactonizing enzyme family protein [Acidaminococcales bacterium]
MKITKIEAIPLKLPLVEPLHWVSGYMTHAEHLLIRIQTDEGIEGITEGVPRPGIYGETQVSIHHIINNVFGPMLTGLDPFDTDKIWAKMNTVFWNPTAKGCLDVGLYDIMGKKTGLPCHKLLGGWTDKVRVSWMVALKSMEEMVKEAERSYAAGYRYFKLKGGIDPDFDIQMVKNIKKVLGPDAKLYIDGNMGYKYLDILKVAKALEGDLVWLEEPMLCSDSQGRKKLSEHIDIPLMGDESLFSLSDAAREIALGALDIVMVKIPRTGYTIGKKFVALAEAYNKPMLMGTQAETTLGTVSCLHFVAAHKQFSLVNELSYFNSIQGSLLNEEIKVTDGCMTVPNGPGLGVTLDEEKVRYFSDLAKK